jgi:hypothetical protein
MHHVGVRGSAVDANCRMIQDLRAYLVLRIPAITELVKGVDAPLQLKEFPGAGIRGLELLFRRQDLVGEIVRPAHVHRTIDQLLCSRFDFVSGVRGRPLFVIDYKAENL